LKSLKKKIKNENNMRFKKGIFNKYKKSHLSKRSKRRRKRKSHNSTSSFR